MPPFSNIFVLVIQLLVNVIKEVKLIYGIDVKGRVKTSLFADATLLTMGSPLMVMDRVKPHLK